MKLFIVCHPVSGREWVTLSESEEKAPYTILDWDVCKPGEYKVEDFEVEEVRNGTLEVSTRARLETY